MGVDGGLEPGLLKGSFPKFTVLDGIPLEGLLKEVLSLKGSWDEDGLLGEDGLLYELDELGLTPDAEEAKGSRF